MGKVKIPGVNNELRTCTAFIEVIEVHPFSVTLTVYTPVQAGVALVLINVPGLGIC
jgi:hypothetical protein